VLKDEKSPLLRVEIVKNQLRAKIKDYKTGKYESTLANPIIAKIKSLDSLFNRNIFPLSRNIFVCRTVNLSASYNFLDSVSAPTGDS